MRLVRAITASDLQNSGYNNATGGNVWARFGKTPLYIYVSSYNANFAEANGVRVSMTGTYLTMHIGTAHQSWKSNEEFALGYQLVPYRDTVAADLIQNKAIPALRVESSAGFDEVCTWAEIYPFTDEGSASFIEYRLSYDLKTATVMVNGRLAKTVTLPKTHDRKTIAMYFYVTPAGNGFQYIRNIYMAFFDPQVEKPYLGRWNCEVLAMGTSDFSNAGAIDGAVDVLSTDPKVAEFTYAGTAKIKGVALSGYALGDFEEKLEVKLVSGTNEATLITNQTPVVGNSDSGLLVNAPNGMLFGSVDFDNVSKKVTATLKLNN